VAAEGRLGSDAEETETVFLEGFEGGLHGIRPCLPLGHLRGRLEREMLVVLISCLVRDSHEEFAPGLVGVPVDAEPPWGRRGRTPDAAIP
jgi:hypothetical protein